MNKFKSVGVGILGALALVFSHGEKAFLEACENVGRDCRSEKIEKFVSKNGDDIYKFVKKPKSDSVRTVKVDNKDEK